MFVLLSCVLYENAMVVVASAAATSLRLPIDFWLLVKAGMQPEEADVELCGECIRAWLVSRTQEGPRNRRRQTDGLNTTAVRLSIRFSSARIEETCESTREQTTLCWVGREKYCTRSYSTHTATDQLCL